MQLRSLGAPLALALVSASGCIPRPVMEGHAYLRGETDNSGIIVGTSFRNSYSDEVVTGNDGSYEINGAIGGDNLVTVTVNAASTVEKQLQFQYIDNGDRAYLPDVTFTPIGTLQGRVVRNGVGVAGVQVGAEGISPTAITDGDGKYVLRDLPTGTYTIAAIPTGDSDGGVTELAGQNVVYNQTLDISDIELQ